jgi:queuine/archaeosine tRNA-ribosyltransferase
MLLTAHNLRYYADLMAAMRTAIGAGRVADVAGAFFEAETRSQEARVECPANPA